jgi:hypothetical protein
MSKNLYRLEVVSNRLGIVHLRLKPPRGSEIILSGELLDSVSGARRTAESLAKGLARGVRIVDVWEGPRIDEPKPEGTPI